LIQSVVPQLSFSFYHHRSICADFSGGQITSDAGLLPLRAFDQRHQLSVHSGAKTASNTSRIRKNSIRSNTVPRNSLVSTALPDKKGQEESMPGKDEQQLDVFSYVSPEQRVPHDHPSRPVRVMTDEALRELQPRFNKLYAKTGRPSIAPEKLLRALLLQALANPVPGRDFHPSSTSAFSRRVMRDLTPTDLPPTSIAEACVTGKEA
jgi:hypothetical protein